MTITQPTLLQFDYATPGPATGEVVFAFAHPAACSLVGQSQPFSASLPPSAKETFAVLVIPATHKDDASLKETARAWLTASPRTADAVSVRSGELQVQWQSSRAILIAPAALAPAALAALVDFFHHETILAQCEAQIARQWSTVEADAPLAYTVTQSDLKNDHAIGQRMQAVLGTQLRLSRLEPGILRPAPHLPAHTRALGEALREATDCEDRLESAVGQIETQQYVYELTSQRLGEHRHARQGFVLETIIIILLAAEVALMAWEWV